MTEPKPTTAEICEWLTSQYRLEREKADSWAGYLEGLKWGHIRPVVQIAVNAHHEHPAIVLASAAAHSEDVVFKLVARNHIAAAGRADHA